MHPFVHVLEELTRIIAHFRIHHHKVAPHVHHLGNMLDEHGALPLAGAAGPATPQLFLENGRPQFSVRVSALAEQRIRLRRRICAVGARFEDGGPVFGQVIFQVSDKLARTQRHPARMGGAHLLAAPAVRAGVQVEQTLPGILAYSIGPERLDGIGVGFHRRLDVDEGEFPARPEITEENIQQAVPDMVDLAESQIAEEGEGRRRVEPPLKAVKAPEVLRAPILHDERERIAHRRPRGLRKVSGELGRGDAGALDDEPLNEDQEEEPQRDPVVQNRVDAIRAQEGAPPDSHADSDNRHQPEKIAREGIPEINRPLEKLGSRPFLGREEGGGDQLGEKPVKNKKVHQAAVGVTHQAAVGEYLGEEASGAPGDLIQPVFAPAQPPEPESRPNSEYHEEEGNNGEEVKGKYMGRELGFFLRMTNLALGRGGELGHFVRVVAGRALEGLLRFGQQLAFPGESGCGSGEKRSGENKEEQSASDVP